MELIDRAEVHDLIAKRLSDYLTDESRKELEELDIKIEEDIPTVEVPSWIPVSERLPEDGETVIASVKGGVYPEARYFKGYGWEWAYESGADYWEELEDVSAWMPLPEPYSEVSE